MKSSFDRRRFMQLASAGVLGTTTSGWMPRLAQAAEEIKSQGRHCVLLWMAGGPSQMDTFDMKPGHANGGSIEEIATDVPGIRFSEHLPKLAQRARHLAILRGMSTKEGDHERGTILLRTGHIPGGPVTYPSIGCSLAKSLGRGDAALPNYVSIAPGAFAQASIRPGFLGPKHAATSVAAAANPPANGFADLKVDYLNESDGMTPQRREQRLALWREMQTDFVKQRATANVIAQNTVYESALRMLASDAKDAFDLAKEPDKVREAYGRQSFGQGCLMARRLIERGVPLVEVTLGNGLGWDTHTDNFNRVEQLSKELDAGWATLMDELDERGLLERTTILWAGEFGRTPKINGNGGRDHFPAAFTCVLAGGGIKGGQVYGATNESGMEVTEGKMNQQDLLSTLCTALDVDPATENMAEGGRPIAIAEGEVIDQVIG